MRLLSARPGYGADGADQLYERAELIIHLPGSGHGAEVEERSERPATVPDVSWTFCVSSTGLPGVWSSSWRAAIKSLTGDLINQVN